MSKEKSKTTTKKVGDAEDGAGRTPLDKAKRGLFRDSPEVIAARKETADLLRKHGDKTGEELKAEKEVFRDHNCNQIFSDSVSQSPA